MSYEDLKEHGSEPAVKSAGKLRQQGKPYESESLALLGTTRILTLDQWWTEISHIGRREAEAMLLRQNMYMQHHNYITLIHLLLLPFDPQRH